MELTDHAIISNYERIARRNRPDWDAFIAEAQAEPSEIAVEMTDTTAEVLARALTDDETDHVYDIAKRWVDSLRGPSLYEATIVIKADGGAAAEAVAHTMTRLATALGHTVDVRCVDDLDDPDAVQAHADIVAVTRPRLNDDQAVEVGGPDGASTVGALRAALAGLPDDTLVTIYAADWYHHVADVQWPDHAAGVEDGTVGLSTAVINTGRSLDTREV